eukprot:UC1_evm1s772
MLNDPAINELSHDWNAVFLRYCDGMSFASNRSDPIPVPQKKGEYWHHARADKEYPPPSSLPSLTLSPPPSSRPTVTKIWLRGLEILKGTFDKLASSYELGMATEVITNGASAGGLATYLHADRMTAYIHEANTKAGRPLARVSALPDSGYWPDDPAKRFSSMFRGWYALQGNISDGLPLHCKWATANVTRCLFPQYFADEIQTRLFPIQSLYDPLQNMAPGSDHDAHANWLLASMNRTIFFRMENDAAAA